MNKDNANLAGKPEPAAEHAVPQAIEQLSPGQPLPPAEQLPLPEAAERPAQSESDRILSEEYHEAAERIGGSGTTEKALVAMAAREGKQSDEVISQYLHEQLPRQDFYEQPVILAV